MSSDTESHASLASVDSTESEFEIDNTYYSALATKKEQSNNKLTPREQVILSAGSNLFPLKCPPNVSSRGLTGTIIYAKSRGSPYWPAFIGPLSEMRNGEPNIHVIFFEENYRVDFLSLSKIIPFKLKDDGGAQRNHVDKLNAIDNKTPISGLKRIAWETSFKMALEFQKIPCEKRLTEQQDRLRISYEKKQNKQTKRREDKSHSTAKTKTSTLGNEIENQEEVVATERSNDHHKLRKNNNMPKTKTINNSAPGTLHHDEELPCTSAAAIAKLKKNDAKAMDEKDLEAIVKTRFEEMDKSFKPQSVSSAACSACALPIEPSELVSCHSMPYHADCVKFIKVSNEDGVLRPMYMCLDCELRRCFVCKTTTPEEAVKCSKCDLYYHRTCLVDRCPQGELQGSYGPIICPTHFCHVCKFEHKINSIPRNYYIPKKVDSLRCILCLATFHKNTCIPAGCGTILCDQYVICPKHIEVNSPDTSKCRKLGCFACKLKVKDKDETVSCSCCPRVWHKACAGTVSVVDNNFTCHTCSWAAFPMYGDVVWFQQPGSSFWPGIILYHSDDRIRAVNRTDTKHFSILYCGPKPQYYDNCNVSRSIPCLAENEGLLKQLGLFNKPAALCAYKEAVILANLSEGFRNKKLGKAKPLFRYADKNIYRIKAPQNRTNGDDMCACGDDGDTIIVCRPESGCYNRSMSMECSDKTCSGKERCVNRFFSTKSRYELALVHFERVGMGFGLKCTIAIPTGSYIMEYKGEVISTEEKERRLNLHQMNEPLYLLELDSTSYIDAEFHGNLSRLMNNSCSPNCRSDKYHSASGKLVIGIFATRRIEINEELTFNYQDENFIKECRCGSANCVSLGRQKENQAPLTDESNWDNHCSVCSLGGDQLLMCDYPDCRKVYHFECVGLSRPPKGSYICPDPDHESQRKLPGKTKRPEARKRSQSVPLNKRNPFESLELGNTTHSRTEVTLPTLGEGSPSGNVQSSLTLGKIDRFPDSAGQISLDQRSHESETPEICSGSAKQPRRSLSCGLEKDSKYLKGRVARTSKVNKNSMAATNSKAKAATKSDELKPILRGVATIRGQKTSSEKQVAQAGALSSRRRSSEQKTGATSVLPPSSSATGLVKDCNSGRFQGSRPASSSEQSRVRKPRLSVALVPLKTSPVVLKSASSRPRSKSIDLAKGSGRKSAPPVSKPFQSTRTLVKVETPTTSKGNWRDTSAVQKTRTVITSTGSMTIVQHGVAMNQGKPHSTNQAGEMRQSLPASKGGVKRGKSVRVQPADVTQRPIRRRQAPERFTVEQLGVKRGKSVPIQIDVAQRPTRIRQPPIRFAEEYYSGIESRKSRPSPAADVSDRPTRTRHQPLRLNVQTGPSERLVKKKKQILGGNHEQEYSHHKTMVANEVQPESAALGKRRRNVENTPHHDVKYSKLSAKASTWKPTTAPVVQNGSSSDRSESDDSSEEELMVNTGGGKKLQKSQERPVAESVPIVPSARGRSVSFAPSVELVDLSWSPVQKQRKNTSLSSASKQPSATEGTRKRKPGRLRSKSCPLDK